MKCSGTLFTMKRKPMHITHVWWISPIFISFCVLFFFSSRIADGAICVRFFTLLFVTISSVCAKVPIATRECYNCHDKFGVINEQTENQAIEKNTASVEGKIASEWFRCKPMRGPEWKGFPPIHGTTFEYILFDANRSHCCKIFRFVYSFIFFGCNAAKAIFRLRRNCVDWVAFMYILNWFKFDCTMRPNTHVLIHSITSCTNVAAFGAKCVFYLQYRNENVSIYFNHIFNWIQISLPEIRGKTTEFTSLLSNRQTIECSN